MVQGVNVGSTGAAIDTGTTFIYAPVELTKLIYAQIPGATPYVLSLLLHHLVETRLTNLESDSVDNAFVGAASAYWQYPCASLNYTTPPVGFSFPSLLPNTPPKTFYINALDFSIGMSSTDNTQCIGAIIGMDIKDFQGNLIAIIGDSFLKGWYSVSFIFLISFFPEHLALTRKGVGTDEVLGVQFWKRQEFSSGRWIRIRHLDLDRSSISSFLALYRVPFTGKEAGRRPM